MMATHFGVYALILRDGEVLLVRKTRGPYDGLFDLPGGASQADEINHETTLARELDEETGLRLTGLGTWFSFEFQLAKDSKGRSADFRHRGVWTVADVELNAIGGVNCRRSEDTSGYVWISTRAWSDRSDLSALARHVLGAAEQNGIF